MKNVAIGLCGAALVFAAGCGSTPQPEGTMTVQGRLTTRTLATDNTRAVAIADDGTQYWAYLDRRGDFTLRLPVGQSYRVVLANQVRGGGQRKIGHVVLRTADGRTEWLGANTPETVDLGRLRLASAASGGTTRPLCGSCGGSGGGDRDDDDDDRDGDRDHDDDHECKRDDGRRSGGGSGSCNDCKDDRDRDDDDDACDVCNDDDDKELEPSKGPGDKCEDKDKDRHKSKKQDRDDDKPCPKKNKGGGSGSGGGSETDEGSGDGGKPSGSKCETSSACTPTCACVASKCEEK